ncbi:unnamed protein product, partial [Cylicostephanus goldi]
MAEEEHSGLGSMPGSTNERNSGAQSTYAQKYSSVRLRSAREVQVSSFIVIFIYSEQLQFCSRSIQYFPEIITTSKRLVDGAKMLNIPIFVTEQYPKGLGHTVPELGLEDVK